MKKVTNQKFLIFSDFQKCAINTVKDEMNKLLAEADSNNSNIKNEIQIIKSIIISLTEASKLLQSRQNQVGCPTCGQPVSKLSKAKLQDRIKTILKNTNQPSFLKAVDLSEQQIKKALLIEGVEEDVMSSSVDQFRKSMEEKVKQLELTHEKNLKSMQENQNLLHQSHLKLSKMKNEILKLENEEHVKLRPIENELQSLTTQINTLRQFQEKSENQMQKWLESVKEVDTQLKDFEHRFQIWKFWEVVFDKKTKATFQTLRAFIFEEAIKELNLILASYMERLCSDDNQLSITLTPTFDFGESYSKRSGGERKRTELVMLLALNDLVMQRSRFLPNFIFLDEVFDALDTDGLHAVQNIIAGLSKKLGKVFVITHSDVIAGNWLNEAKKNAKITAPLFSQMQDCP